MNLSRVHLHPYGSFLICYDQSKWHDAYDSIVKSSISVPKYCLSDNSGADLGGWEDQHANFALADMPETIQGNVKVNKDSLTYDFDLAGSDVHSTSSSS